jgi:hypothetical protein
MAFCPPQVHPAGSDSEMTWRRLGQLGKAPGPGVPGRRPIISDSCSLRFAPTQPPLVTVCAVPHSDSESEAHTGRRPLRVRDPACHGLGGDTVTVGQSLLWRPFCSPSLAHQRLSESGQACSLSARLSESRAAVCEALTGRAASGSALRLPHGGPGPAAAGVTRGMLGTRTHVTCVPAPIQTHSSSHRGRRSRH